MTAEGVNKLNWSPFGADGGGIASGDRLKANNPPFVCPQGFQPAFL